MSSPSVSVDIHVMHIRLCINLGSGGMLTQKILKLRGSEMLFYKFGDISENNQGITKTCFQLLSYNTSVPENVDSTYSLDCPDKRTVKIQSHSKKPVFCLNYSLQFTQCLIS